MSTLDNKRIGIIGLDAMHAVALTKFINTNTLPRYDGYRVVAAYAHDGKIPGNRKERVAGYIQTVQGSGVKIVDSIAELLGQVDSVILTSNNGYVHLEQAAPVLEAGKPLFIDKPIAATLEDTRAIFRLSEQYNTPVFSSSALRFIDSLRDLKNENIGDILGAQTFSPASTKPDLPDLLWYGIHGIEMLYAVMGTGCATVTRTATPDFDYVVGVWEDGRIGSYRGMRKGRTGFGGTVYGSRKNSVLGGFGGYEPLAAAVLDFFQTGRPPVSPRETIEMITFIMAAEESKRNNGQTIHIKNI